VTACDLENNFNQRAVHFYLTITVVVANGAVYVVKVVVDGILMLV